MIKHKVIPVLLCCFFMTACDEKKEPDAPPPRVIKTFTIESDLAQNIRIFPARIQAGDNTDLAFKRPGQLITLNIRDGTAVKAGQTLATALLNK
ncbi:hypothetical protein NAS92_22435 [Pantoea brenneri]|uniref:hypothetical protein n=1 Tax=Pantoea brenneri TaxID=472694 RepID=UPI00210A9EA0|nr:hypothetical protein [Pantoea brenneri]MCQ5473207.1 hypothetical protein [Pantoea brenneri]